MSILLSVLSLWRSVVTVEKQTKFPVSCCWSSAYCISALQFLELVHYGMWDSFVELSVWATSYCLVRCSFHCENQSESQEYHSGPVRNHQQIHNALKLHNNAVATNFRWVLASLSWSSSMAKSFFSWFSWSASWHKPSKTSKPVQAFCFFFLLPMESL